MINNITNQATNVVLHENTTSSHMIEEQKTHSGYVSLYQQNQRYKKNPKHTVHQPSLAVIDSQKRPSQFQGVVTFTSQELRAPLSSCNDFSSNLDYQYYNPLKTCFHQVKQYFKGDNSQLSYYQTNGWQSHQMRHLNLHYMHLNPDNDNTFHCSVRTKFKPNEALYHYYEYLKDVLFPIVSDITNGGIIYDENSNSNVIKLKSIFSISKKGYFSPKDSTLAINRIFTKPCSTATITHEFGHFLGLEHPFESTSISNILIKPQIDRQYDINSIMSYASFELQDYNINIFEYLLAQDDIITDKKIKNKIQEFITHFHKALTTGFTPLDILTLEAYYSPKNTPRKAEDIITEIGIEWFMFKRGEKQGEIIYCATENVITSHQIKTYSPKINPLDPNFTTAFHEKYRSNIAKLTRFFTPVEK